MPFCCWCICHTVFTDHKYIHLVYQCWMLCYWMSLVRSWLTAGRLGCSTGPYATLLFYYSATLSTVATITIRHTHTLFNCAHHCTTETCMMRLYTRRFSYFGLQQQSCLWRYLTQYSWSFGNAVHCATIGWIYCSPRTFLLTAPLLTDLSMGICTSVDSLDTALFAHWVVHK